MTRRQLTSDVLVGSLLIGVTYATPARLRPALGLALAVTLSRQHGADLVRLFDERESVKRHLQYTVDPELDELAHRLDGLERNMTEDVVAHEFAERLEDLEALVLVLGDGAISPGGFADRALERVRSRFMTRTGRTP